jgi:hypothetical protein
MATEYSVLSGQCYPLVAVDLPLGTVRHDNSQGLVRHICTLVPYLTHFVCYCSSESREVEIRFKCADFGDNIVLCSNLCNSEHCLRNFVLFSFKFE